MTKETNGHYRDKIYCKNNTKPMNTRVRRGVLFRLQRVKTEFSSVRDSRTVTLNLNILYNSQYIHMYMKADCRIFLINLVYRKIYFWRNWYTKLYIAGTWNFRYWHTKIPYLNIEQRFAKLSISKLRFIYLVYQLMIVVDDKLGISVLI